MAYQKKSFKMSKAEEPIKEEAVEEPVAEQAPAVIKHTTTALNVRKSAKKDAAVVEVLAPNAEVEVLSERGEWSKVESGWCMSRFLA